MIKYNGVDLGDYGVCVIGRGTFNAPARDVEKIHVNGKNGDYLIDHGSFQNITVTYPDCCIIEDFPRNVRALRQLLYRDAGYHRLEDSYNPDTYRLAQFAGPFEAEVHTGRGNRSGTFPLNFDCKPQRFLKSGDRRIQVPLQYANGSSGYLIYCEPDGASRFSLHAAARAFDVQPSAFSSSATCTVRFFRASGTEISNAQIAIAGKTMAECEIPNGTTLMMIVPSVHIGGLKINGIMFDYGTSMSGSIPNLGTMPAAPLYELVKGTTAPLTIRGYDADRDRIGETGDQIGDGVVIDGLNETRHYMLDAESGEVWRKDATETGLYKYIEGVMPTIPSGGLQISFSAISSTTRLYVIPRWWEM